MGGALVSLRASVATDREQGVAALLRTPSDVSDTRMSPYRGTTLGAYTVPRQVRASAPRTITAGKDACTTSTSASEADLFPTYQGTRLSSSRAFRSQIPTLTRERAGAVRGSASVSGRSMGGGCKAILRSGEALFRRFTTETRSTTRLFIAVADACQAGAPAGIPFRFGRRGRGLATFLIRCFSFIFRQRSNNFMITISSTPIKTLSKWNPRGRNKREVGIHLWVAFFVIFLLVVDGMYKEPKVGFEELLQLCRLIEVSAGLVLLAPLAVRL